MIRAAVAGCAMVAVCAASSCTSLPAGSAGGDKAGGHEGPVTLRVGDTAFAPGASLAYFAQRIDQDSHGQLQVSFVNQFADFAPDAEPQLVRAVAAGKVDLGWVGSRAFDSLGVSSLTALSSPMLIDDRRLEGVVLAGPLGGQMLAGLTKVGVTGLAAVPAEITVPVGVSRALVNRQDWRGIGFGTYDSRVQEDAVRALGATPVEVLGPLRSHALSVNTIAGFALDIPAYERLSLVSQASYVAVNVGLWPDAAVAFANSGRLSGLDSQQRGWVQKAAAETTTHARSSGADVNASIRAACAEGAHFVRATPTQLAALRNAFAGIYTALEKDSQTKSFIAQIRRLKAATPPEQAPQIPTGCSAVS